MTYLYLNNALSQRQLIHLTYAIISFFLPQSIWRAKYIINRVFQVLIYILLWNGHLHQQHHFLQSIILFYYFSLASLIFGKIVQFNEFIGHSQVSQQQRVDINNRRQSDVKKHQEAHKHIGQILKSLVYGGVDGSTNTLIIIASSVSSGVAAGQILALCIATCIGDAIGMGLGDYLSLMAQIEFIKSQEQKQYYQFDHFLQKEKEKFLKGFKVKFFSLQDSIRISQLYSTNKKAFIDIIMLQLNLVVIAPVFAVKCGLATFISFLLFGILPAIPFIITHRIMKQETKPWLPSICIGFVEFIGLGLLKTAIAGGNKLKSCLQILLLCSAATAIGYGIGKAFTN